MVEGAASIRLAPTNGASGTYNNLHTVLRHMMYTAQPLNKKNKWLTADMRHDAGCNSAVLIFKDDGC